MRMLGFSWAATGTTADMADKPVTAMKTLSFQVHHQIPSNKRTITNLCLRLLKRTLGEPGVAPRLRLGQRILPQSCEKKSANGTVGVGGSFRCGNFLMKAWWLANRVWNGVIRCRKPV